MTSQELLQHLRDRKRVFGTAIISDSPHWMTVVGGLGLDFVFIDTEHIPLDRRTLAWMCRAYAAAGLPPLVRIPSPEPQAARAALDGGAAGILAPYIESAEQVRRLAGAVKLRPIQGLRLEAALKGRPIEPELGPYLAQFNAGRFLLVNVESTPAIEALDDILSVEALDGVIIGPHDLSSSLGVPEQYDHPTFMEAVGEIIDRSVAARKSVGIHLVYGAMDQEIMWGERGANVILHSADVIAFAQTIGREIAEIRKALGECGTSDRGSIAI